MAFEFRTGRTTAAALTALSALLGGIGCNAILGIDEGHLVSTDAGAGGSKQGSGGSSVDAGNSGNGGALVDSGAGGASAGESGSGGKNFGGASAGGAGGVAAGGSPGTGGSGAGGVAGGVPNEVHCGTASCKISAGQACCVATATGDAHCAASCDSSTQVRFSCDGAEDCTGANNKCCYPTAATTATCAATCTGRVFCGADKDCAPGEYCAPGSGALSTVSVCKTGPKAKTVWCNNALCDLASGNACCYNKTTQSESCLAATACGGSSILFACDGPEDCGGVGNSCCETRTGLGLFTGTQCVSGACGMGVTDIKCGGANGCAAGESCCLQATSTTCGTTCSSQSVCGTAADCAGQSCTVITDTTIGKATGRSVCVTPP